jgi:hypothetical protein
VAWQELATLGGFTTTQAGVLFNSGLFVFGLCFGAGAVDVGLD